MTILNAPTVQWAQTYYHVFIWVYSACIKSIKITVSEKHVSFENKLQNKQLGNSLEIDLFGEVIVEDCQAIITNIGAKIVLKKINDKDWFWDRLVAQEEKPEWLSLASAEQMALISNSNR